MSWSARLAHPLVVKKILLGPTGIRSEIFPRESAQLAPGHLLPGEVAPSQGSFHPDINREGRIMSATEKQGAKRNLFADPANCTEHLNRIVQVHLGQLSQPDLAGNHRLRRRQQVLGAKPELAVAEFPLTASRQTISRREAMKHPVIGRDRIAEAAGKFANNLADLNDLLGRAGHERRKRLPGFLAQHPQPAMRLDRRPQLRIRGERREDVRQGPIQGEVLPELPVTAVARGCSARRPVR